MNFLIAWSFIFSFLIASIELDGQSSQADFEIVASNPLGFVGEFRSGKIEIDDIHVVDNVFSMIRSHSYHSSQSIGAPELPELHRLIEIPQGSIPRIEILDEEYKVYDLHALGFSQPLFPHQPSLSKSQDPANVNFEFNASIYGQNSYIVEEMVAIEDKGMLRSMRLGNLIIRPVDYNPAKGLLKIWKKISIKVHFDGADLILTENLKLKHHSPYFDVLYESVMNHDVYENRDDLVNYPVTYAIITNPIFENSLSDFIDWKIQKGFNVVVGNTAEIGSSTSSIKAFLQDLYENPADGLSSPSFVLFVGDIAQVPSYSGSTGSHPTDLYYCEYTGDLIPEVYHGRFSAQNINHLQAQISKTLEYEKYEMPDPSYLSEVLMVSGVDGSFAATHGNGQINYGNDYYFNNDHGIYSHTYLYPASDGSGAAAAIIQDYNEGVGFANYTAHCSPSGWADPSFTVSDVPGLYNDYEYNLMIGNCCNSAQFDVESFGEAVLRSENNGAVGYIGGTNSTYWDEDYWWGVGSGSVSANPTYESTGIGVYDGIFHENGEDEEQWFVVNDAINMSGNLAVVEAGSSLDDYYWEIYHNMGDPSLITYMGIPIENNVSHLPILQIGTNSFNVSADPYSFVALSMDGVLYGTAYMGSSSNVEMEIIPFNVAGTASVVVTGQNKQPYFGSVEVGNADGPYVVVDEFMLLSSDGDEVIEYGETVNVSMTLKNVGNEITSGITVTLSINDEYITLMDDQSAFGDLMPEETVTLENIFSFSVSSQVPDDYSFSMVANVWGSGQFWDYNLNMTAFAPVLSFEGVEVVSELDGQLDPGDTADIGVIMHNSGGSDLSGMNVIISSEDEYVTINGDSNYFLDNLNVDESAAAYYNVSADSNTPIGHIMSFNIMVTSSGSYEEDLFGSLTVGLTWEDFESGSFVGLPWNFSGNADWQISSDGYEGMYGAESGSIIDNETSELNVSANVTAGDDISFYYKVSSEGSYDYLRFYIDGVEQGAWSGDIGWTQASFSVSPGEHLFRWVYSKDGSVSSGSDMAWIDYIVFPPIGAPMFPEINISVEELSLDLEVDSQEVEQFVISNSGEGDLQYNIQVVLDSPESSIQYESVKLDKGEISFKYSSYRLISFHILHVEG